MKRISLAFAIALPVAACGGATNTANTPEAAPMATATTPPKAAEPGSKPTPVPAPTNEAVATSAPNPAEATAEKCDGAWVCVRVSFDKKKVEPRETKLLGDPKIEQTWSKNSDGRTATFDAFSKGAVELTLRRKPGDKNEVVVKLAKGGEIVIDRRDGTLKDITHVGAIAAEQNGDLLIDLRYMK